MIVIYHTRKSSLAVLCSSAIPTVGLEESIGPVFSKIRLRSQMKEAAKLQQVRFISVPREKQSSDDVEDGPPSKESDVVPPSQEGDGIPPSHGGDGLPPSQEGNDVPSFHEGDDVSPLYGIDGHEMVFVRDGVENQESVRRRTDDDRSIVSTISLDSRGA